MTDDHPCSLCRTAAIVAFTIVVMQTLTLFAILMRQSEIMRTRANITVDRLGHVVNQSDQHSHGGD